MRNNRKKQSARNHMNLGLPLDLTWYKLLTDWGSLIGGCFALIAGFIAYRASCIQAIGEGHCPQLQHQS